MVTSFSLLYEPLELSFTFRGPESEQVLVSKHCTSAVQFASAPRKLERSPRRRKATGDIHGWVCLLVRPSGTEKLIRVMGEGHDETLVNRVVSEVPAAVLAAG